MGMGQNLVPLVNIKIAGKWMFIPLKMVLINIDPYPYGYIAINNPSAAAQIPGAEVFAKSALAEQTTPAAVALEDQAASASSALLGEG